MKRVGGNVPREGGGNILREGGKEGWGKYATRGSRRGQREM